MRAEHAHAEQAAGFLQDPGRVQWHDAAVWQMRLKRDAAAARVPEWEELRRVAAALKDHMLSHWADYLQQFEQQATAAGAVVHYAVDAAEHNRIVLGLLQEHGVRRLVKSKSMLTEECGLNPFLEDQGIEVVDTDLGERIVQWAKERPSHLVMPAIHKKVEEIDRLFQEKVNSPPANGNVQQLADSARIHLRQKFLKAQAALTGVNFAVAENGLIVVCTNEGNADLGTTLPPLHIACVGMEKLVPRIRDLGVFLRLLARSATGQPITAYTSHFRGPRPGGELHIVIVDNGRSRLRARKDFASALRCIRCGSCLNTCPVYRRSGGHSYGTVIPGPIGSVLAPQQDLPSHRSLPFASSLCGSCTTVCPVKIPLHHQLLAARAQVVQAGLVSWRKRLLLRGLAALMMRPRLYSLVTLCLRRLLRIVPRRLLYGRSNRWGRQRELPPLLWRSFRDLVRRRDDLSN
jgi:L-lactate dehydrogenase complex protein LldF